MTNRGLERAKAIAAEATELQPERRLEHIRKECGGDAKLLSDVLNLLEANLSDPVLAADGPAGTVQEPKPGLEKGRAAFAEGAPQADVAGALLKGRYRIEKVLGRGGFAVTYLATDTQLDSRPVVVKVLLGHHTDDAWVLKKFHLEMRALARLDHPGVVAAVDVGELPDGRPFLVMQFVRGAALRELIHPTRGMDLEKAGRIVRQAGSGLSAAHREGICHRDVKPENIMLQSLGDGEEQVKLIDFGIASIRDARAASSGDSTKIAGTLAYMAPEQFQGQSSPASDIYALGVVAYELVTGRPPFTPENPLQLLGLHLEGVKVKPKDLRPNLPEAAQSAILKALAKKPEDRFSTAREFGDAFANGLASSSQPAAVPPVETTAPRPPKSKLDLRLITGGVLVTAIAAVALAFWRINVETSGKEDGGKNTRAAVSVPKPAPVETKSLPPAPSVEGSGATKAAATGTGSIERRGQPGSRAGAGKVNPKDGQRYRWIPPGFFQMGCSSNDVECIGNERPVRIVTITQGFWIGETEVTQAAYQKVTGQNSSISKGPKLPVDNISWTDAQSYCEAVGMRLPTEAEWEYAARAGSEASRYGDLASIAWYRVNSEARTHEVGRKSANAWGLHDTLGNLWEWVADWHGVSYSSNSEVDPGGPASGQYRSTRGGGFPVDARNVRVSIRRRDPPERRSAYVGFRCVESSLVPRTTAMSGANPAAGQQHVNARDGLTYVWIPPGTFRIGCSPGDTQCSPNESPGTQVTLTKGFWMGQTEVTREAYRRVAASASGSQGEDRLPAGSVRWDQARAYCGAAGLRLPTEAEWEYAARGGSSAPRYGDVNAVAWWSGNSYEQVHGVAGKQPNTYGLYDMLGNQREWVADWYDASYYSRGPQTDPQGPPNGEARVIRGGAWKGLEDRIRVSTRLWSQPGAIDSTNGFRCAGPELSAGR